MAQYLYNAGVLEKARQCHDLLDSRDVLMYNCSESSAKEALLQLQSNLLGVR